MAGETLIQIRQERIEKAKKLRDMGIDPYPARTSRSIDNKQIIDNYEEFADKEVIVGGRLMSWREHGGLIFGHILDQSGKVQLYIKEDELVKTDVKTQVIGFENLNLLDVGDFVEVKGSVTKTKRGEISILAKEIKILAKTIRPLPDQWEGISNTELRYRRRYLDLVINPEKKQMFERKSKFWDANRAFMKQKGFMEVETPVLEIVTGGADASPFTTHHNALDQDFYLRISTELYLKRLIGAGYEKIYTLGPNFRNEGIDDEHLQEYYQIEWYYAYADYKKNMEMVRDMMRYVAKEVYGKTEFETKNHKFDLANDWEEVDYVEIIKKTYNIDIFTSTDEEMLEVIKNQNIKLPGIINRSRLIDNIWKSIRKKIAGPAFLINEPKFMSPLAKSRPEDERLTERFHVIIAGSELGNGYSEINDPIDQLERFIDQQKLRESGDDEAQMLDIDYVEMLEYGMPPTSGYAHSERLFWFFENVSAREGTFFPQMKHEIDDVTMNVYSDIKKYLGVGLNSKEKSNLDLSEIEKSTAAIIDPEVESNIKGIKFGFITIEGVKVEKTNELSDMYKKKAAEKTRAKYKDVSEIKSSENLDGYRQIYKATGVDPRSRLNSAEALIKRIVSGKDIYNVNNVVDTYNSTSVETEMPMAAYDLDKISGKLKLRFSEEGEEILKIGEEEVTKTEKGELVYSDDLGITCIDFNYRDSDRTKVTDSTKRLIVFVDGHEGISKEQIIDGLNLVASRLVKSTGGEVKSIGFSWKDEDQSSKFVVGKVESVEKHSNADRLFVCKVNIGNKTVQIVTGADNVKAGDFVPVALQGAVIPNKKDKDGNDLVIKEGKIRGEVSEAMMCSMDELGKGTDAEGIWILDAEKYKTKVGEDFDLTT